MTEKKKPDFDPGDVSDIYDKLSAHSFALQAFGVLLRSSDLSDFADRALAEQVHPQKNLGAANLRWGLSQIIELYLAHQESILSEHLDEYYKTDAVFIRDARNTLSFVEQRGFVSREVAVNRLRKAVKILEIVIDRGGDLMDKALELKDICLKHITQLIGK